MTFLGANALWSIVEHHGDSDTGVDHAVTVRAEARLFRVGIGKVPWKYHYHATMCLRCLASGREQYDGTSNELDGEADSQRSV